jgi:CTP:phosphocholine cytidylyltransferase-like protein
MGRYRQEEEIKNMLVCHKNIYLAPNVFQKHIDYGKYLSFTFNYI